MTTRIVLGGLFLSTVAFWPNVANAQRSQQPTAPTSKTYTTELILANTTLQAPMKVIGLVGEVFAVEREGKAIVAIRPDGTRRPLGGVVAGRRQLLYPFDLASDGKGALFVLDSSGLVGFTVGGESLGDFPVSGARSLAVKAASEIVFNHPHNDTLLSEYSSKGEPVRTFGTQLRLSDVSPPSDIAAERLPAFERGLNWAYLAASDNDSILVAFRHTPEVRKYNSKGVLLWKVRPQAAFIAAIQDQYWHPTRTVLIPRLGNVDGYFQTFSGIAADPVSGMAYVLSGDSRILAVDKNGHWQSTYTDERLLSPTPTTRGFGRVSAISFFEGRAHIVARDNVYRLTLGETPLLPEGTKPRQSKSKQERR